MLMAQLRGKLVAESWLTSEDLLTSAVFGTPKNLPSELRPTCSPPRKLSTARTAQRYMVRSGGASGVVGHL